MSTGLTVINTLIGFSVLLNLIYGVIIFAHNPKESINKRLFVLTIIVSLWGVLMIIYRSHPFSDGWNLFITRLLYADAALIPLSFIYLAAALAKIKILHYKIISASFFLSLVSILYLVFSPDLLILGVLRPTIGEQVILFNNILHIVYGFYLFSLFSIGFGILIDTYRNTKKLVTRSQIFYLIIGASVATFISFVTNLILPITGDFTFNWVGQISISFMAAFITYGIYKEQIFNTKIALTELVVSASWVLLSINVLFSQTITTRILTIIPLIIFTFLGYMIIHTMKKEISTKERIEEVATSLEKANKKLKELDEKKNEFLHIATHQLRGPITAINGYASLILEGDYGDMPKSAKVPINNILSASKVMSETINDYMNIARIEEDNVVQNMTEFDLCELVDERVEVRLVNAQDKGIKMTIEHDVEGDKCMVKADKNNITQVLNALLENAIKYTHKGEVQVRTELSESGKRVRVSIKDTGIGVAKGEVAGLFDKFTRADNAKETDAFGTGMGLFIAKNLIEANKGKIWVESEGLNKGSTFTIELPVVAFK